MLHLLRAVASASVLVGHVKGRTGGAQSPPLAAEKVSRVSKSESSRGATVREDITWTVICLPAEKSVDQDSGPDINIFSPKRPTYDSGEMCEL